MAVTSPARNEYRNLQFYLKKKSQLLQKSQISQFMLSPIAPCIYKFLPFSLRVFGVRHHISYKLYLIHSTINNHISYILKSTSLSIHNKKQNPVLKNRSWIFNSMRYEGWLLLRYCMRYECWVYEINKIEKNFNL